MKSEPIGDLLDAVHPTQVGRSVVLPATSQELTVIRLAGPDTRTQMLTATIARGDVDTGAGDVNLIAIARWGAGGAQQVATMDLVNGTVVSVPGSYLEIAARNDGNIPIQVSATAGYGARSSHGRAPSLTEERSIPATGSATAPVPKFATQVVVLFPTPVLPPLPIVDVDVLTATGTVLHNAFDITSGDAFALPSRAFSVRVTSSEAVVAQVVFLLAL